MRLRTGTHAFIETGRFYLQKFFASCANIGAAFLQHWQQAESRGVLNVGTIGFGVAKALTLLRPVIRKGFA
jgi:hypothetical protein